MKKLAVKLQGDYNMTGATSLGIALPAMSEDVIAEGSLKEAVFHISKQQCELNEMFKEVITDFQVRLLDNQSMVIERIENIESSLSEMAKLFRIMTEVLKVISEKLPDNNMVG